MIPRRHWYFTTAETLEASKLTQNLRLLADDVNDGLSRRYTYSSYTLDFSGLIDTGVPATSSAAAEFLYVIPTLWAYDIVGVEIELYADTNVTNVSITPTGTTGGQEATEVAGAGSTTRAFVQNAFVAQALAGGNIAYTLTVTASSTPWTLTACRVNVLIRSDRGNAGASHPNWTPANIAYPGKTTSQAEFNTEMTNAQASWTAFRNNQNRLRMEVYTRRNIAAGAMPSSDQDLPVPYLSREVAQVVTGVVCAATSSMRGAVCSSSTELTGATVTGTGVTTLNTATTTSTQTLTVPVTTGASDGLIRLARVSGTDAIPFVYTVVYWSK